MKRTIKTRLIAAMLFLTTLLSFTAPAFAAADYSELISSILDDMNTIDESCSGAPQQSANGAYRLVEMLAIIATKGNDGTYSDVISGVLNDLDTNNASCSGAPQQTANGTYRAVELLAIIALEHDTTGAFKDVISNQLTTLTENNASCSGAPQQSANGLYRCAELLAIIAYELDVGKNAYSDSISDVLNRLQTQNESCGSAVQQEVNGAYRCVELLAIIAYELDTYGIYSSLISGVLTSLSDVNDTCSSAPPQLANGMYRCVEMAALVATAHDTTNASGDVDFSDNFGDVELDMDALHKNIDQSSDDFNAAYKDVDMFNDYAESAIGNYTELRKQFGQKMITAELVGSNLTQDDKTQLVQIGKDMIQELYDGILNITARDMEMYNQLNEGGYLADENYSSIIDGLSDDFVETSDNLKKLENELNDALNGDFTLEETKTRVQTVLDELDKIAQEEIERT